jgi:hypothetical protein
MYDPSLKSSVSSFTRKKGLRTLVASPSKSAMLCSAVVAAFDIPELETKISRFAYNLTHLTCERDRTLGADRSAPTRSARPPAARISVTTASAFASERP